MSLEGIIDSYNAERAAERANYDVTPEEKTAYAMELARTEQNFDLLIKDRRHVGPSRDCNAHETDAPKRDFYRCIFESVSMGAFKIGESISFVAVQPSQEVYGSGTHPHRRLSLGVVDYGGENLTARRMHFYFGEIRRLVVRTDEGATKDRLKNIRDFRHLLDEVLVQAGVDAPLIVDPEELPIYGY